MSVIEWAGDWLQEFNWRHRLGRIETAACAGLNSGNFDTIATAVLREFGPLYCSLVGLGKYPDARTCLENEAMRARNVIQKAAGTDQTQVLLKVWRAVIDKAHNRPEAIWTRSRNWLAHLTQWKRFILETLLVEGQVDQFRTEVREQLSRGDYAAIAKSVQGIVKLDANGPFAVDVFEFAALVRGYLHRAIGYNWNIVLPKVWEHIVTQNSSKSSSKNFLPPGTWVRWKEFALATVFKPAHTNRMECERPWRSKPSQVKLYVA